MAPQSTTRKIQAVKPNFVLESLELTLFFEADECQIWIPNLLYMYNMVIKELHSLYVG
jgi:hypothetical protein